MRVDAHQHFWNIETGNYPWLNRPENQPINRTFGPKSLEPLLNEVGIDQTVLVQAMDSAEDTHAMLELADIHDWIGAVVGWVELDQPNLLGEQLENLMKHTKFKGVRHLIHEESDPNWIMQDSVIEGLKLLAYYKIPFDVVAVFPNHLEHVPRLAERVPELKMVIDHLAKPPIRSGRSEIWKTQLAQAAEYPQVFAKVSGLNTAADWDKWSHTDLEPYVDFACTTFGPDRLMFGSDWPVATLAGDYRKVWDETHKALESYGPAVQDAIFGKTAEKFYNLRGESYA